MKKTYYITTPIYFPSDKLHIGHSYTTVVCDAMARYKKLRGYDVKFLTGTDEHGQKIERIAEKLGTTPKAYVDNIVASIKDLWKILDIDYDIYIRTTDENHEKTVQMIFKKLYDQGDIYKSSYEGKYCTPCETFFTDHQLVDGKCPDCGRDIEVVKEESYFFRLSKYQDRIIKLYEENPNFIQPSSRKNEMLSNFLKKGLEDLCVSRTTIKWGIPVEFDPEHVVYVWVDALSNYISALGYGSEDDSLYKKYWPADVHVVGKEIVRFHTIIWPALLMALDEPMPKQVFGHGWLVINGTKMGKSLGNVVDPVFLVEKYGSDSIRYFLLREIAFGQDGNFTNELLINRMNADLANDLGNLVSRTVGMIEKYFDGQLPMEQEPMEADEDLKKLIIKTVEIVEEKMDKMFFNEALIAIWDLISATNKYIDSTEPWFLVKDESKKANLANIMYVLAETIRSITILIEPAMPNTPSKIYEQLNITEERMKTWESSKEFGLLPKDLKVTKGEIIFPRIDLKKELLELEEIQKKSMENSVVNKIKKDEEENINLITIDDFGKVSLKVGEIIKCEKVPKADKLLKSQIKIGNETRQILSGIAKAYEPEDLIGKKVVVVTNLSPVKLRGELSEGMILAASDSNGNLKIVTIDGDIETGSEVS